MICMLLVEINQMPTENSMYTIVYTHIVAQCCTHTVIYIYEPEDIEFGYYDYTFYIYIYGNDI
jgi:hypothetical protein